MVNINSIISGDFASLKFGVPKVQDFGIFELSPMKLPSLQRVKYPNIKRAQIYYSITK